MSIHRALSGTPATTEWSPYHLGYLKAYLPGIAPSDALSALLRGHEDDARTFLELQRRAIQGLAAEIPAAKEHFRYAPGKWTVRELLGHLADTERILNWRALAAARGDKTNILPFDENEFAAAAGHDTVPVERLVEELLAVRTSTLAMVANFDHEAWRRKGRSNGFLVSARAWIFVIGCHMELHLNTLRKRYLA